MDLSDEILIEISYVKISANRTKVLKCLEGKKVMIPTEISKQTGIISNHISENLNNLRDHGLLECINPEARKGRLYRLTEKGESVAKNIDSVEFK